MQALFSGDFIINSDLLIHLIQVLSDGRDGLPGLHAPPRAGQGCRNVNVPDKTLQRLL